VSDGADKRANVTRPKTATRAVCAGDVSDLWPPFCLKASGPGDQLVRSAPSFVGLYRTIAHEVLIDLHQQ